MFLHTRSSRPSKVRSTSSKPAGYRTSCSSSTTNSSSSAMTSFDDNLLTAVSRHPILYNHMRRDYKNSEAKIMAWEDIQKELDIDEPVEKIRQRWKSIRDSYVKYLNKTKDKTGSRVRPYKFEKQLNFLKPFLTGNQKEGILHLDDDDSHLDVTETIVIPVTTPTHEESPEMDTSTVLSNKRKRTQNAEREHFLYENQQETSSAPASEYRIFSQMDDIDILFYGLAQTMKKLRPLTVAKLKKEIANLVNDAEIRELEQVESVKDEGFARS